MGMTTTEKILAQHADKGHVNAGDNIWINVDILLTHDVTGPGTIAIFKKEFGENAKVWDKEKVVIIPDHYIFTANKQANRNVEIVRKFSQDQSLPHYYDVGTENYKGVCHVALPEEGFARPGSVIFGTDSHTCTAGAFGLFATGIGNTDAAFVMGTGKLWVKVPSTQRFNFGGTQPNYLMAKDYILKILGDIGVDGASYGAMEFAGDAVYGLNMEERMTLCNMAIEGGGKNGIIVPDQVTHDYVKARTDAEYNTVIGDSDASYVNEYNYDVSTMQPQVACPHSPDNVKPVGELGDIVMDRAYIGSCTGGKVTDFKAAAEILNGHEVKIKTFIVPATTDVEKALNTETIGGKTYMQIFKDAGCEIGQPSCAACLGGPADTFGRIAGPEKCISTTNRNFPGRMGSKQSEVFLASPYTVAATALRGNITHPQEYLN